MFEFTACLWRLALAAVTAAFMTHLRTVPAARRAGSCVRAERAEGPEVT